MMTNSKIGAGVGALAFLYNALVAFWGGFQTRGALFSAMAAVVLLGLTGWYLYCDRARR